MCEDRGEPLVRALGAHDGHPECGALVNSEPV